MRSENGTYLLRWQVRPNSFWAVSRRGWWASSATAI
jgi:hypothetical protein